MPSDASLGPAMSGDIEAANYLDADGVSAVAGSVDASDYKQERLPGPQQRRRIRANPLVVWEQDETLTREQVMKARGLWHQTRVVVIVASSRSRMGRPMGGMTEAHCTCGWNESFKTYREACDAADGHRAEQGNA